MEILGECSLNCPENFDFPFPPYDIQKEFMKSLYKTINDRKFGIFESPTGTGKSLSILCGAIRWLKDHNVNQRENLSKIIQQYRLEKEKLAKNSSDWLSLQSKEIEIDKKLCLIKLQQNKILEYDQKIKKLEESVKNTKIDHLRNFKLKRKVDSIEKKPDENVDPDEIDDELLVCDEPEEVDQHSDEENDESDKFEPVKIYICSRTHSQLSQFVGEIIKSPFGKNVRAVSLASRQVYCINPEVRRLKSMALINERCLDMQKSSAKETKKEKDGKVTKKRCTKNCKCPYYKSQQIENLRDFALVEVSDVEDLVTAGKQLNACPYYASRKAADDAEIILVPYNTLLHKATREANGIKLKNNVVIIDEAHNLLESLAQMHNNEVSLHQIEHALNQLKGYQKKFAKRFSPTNLLMINQLIFVTTKLKHVLEKNSKKSEEPMTEIFTTGDFELRSEIDNFNMFKLSKFAKDAKLPQKVHYYALKYPIEEESLKRPVEKGVKGFLSSIKNNKQAFNTKKDSKKEEEISEETDAKKQLESAPVNPLLSVVSFLECLTYSYEDGRIMVVRDADKKLCKLRFLLLNPSSLFKTIVDEARSVIVAGGTMKPITEFRDRLFIGAGATPEKIVEFSCDHIIPPENILPIVLTKNSDGNNLLFTFDTRQKMGNSVKTILQEACKRINGGIVVFFPSYQYESWLWEQLKDVSFGRPVFREPKDAGSVDVVLEKYAEAINKSKNNGALMFSVVGGKLSEGLNFSDDLGRCVIVVGLPYANIKAPDLKEKMTYLDKKEGYGAGQKLYGNLCMKAVNQCIGRAVRHRNDYAAVLLLDERYNRSSTKNALPGWIKRSLQVCEYEDAFSQIDKFFQNKRKDGLR